MIQIALLIFAAKEIEQAEQRVRALEGALRHEIYRNHEHTEACSACRQSDAALTPPSAEEGPR